VTRIAIMVSSNLPLCNAINPGISPRAYPDLWLDWGNALTSPPLPIMRRALVRMARNPALLDRDERGDPGADAIYRADRLAGIGSLQR
jgi:hypothetical protein